MRLDELCTMDLRYRGPLHLARPYGHEAGLGWGVGDGSVSGQRLAGAVQWSNHPARRGDGVMLPDGRGVITTGDGAEVLFSVTGRTVVVERDGKPVGRLLLLVLFESEHERYAWLNNTVCVGEGVIDPVTHTIRVRVFSCESET